MIRNCSHESMFSQYCYLQETCLLFLTFSQAHKKMHLGKPCPSTSSEEFSGGIVNGAAWYVVSGGMQDWNYLNSNCFEITLEVGCYKFPPANQLPSFWLDNREAVLAYIEAVSSYPVLELHLSLQRKNNTTASSKICKYFCLKL